MDGHNGGIGFRDELDNEIGRVTEETAILPGHRHGRSSGPTRGSDSSWWKWFCCCCYATEESASGPRRTKSSCLWKNSVGIFNFLLIAGLSAALFYTNQQSSQQISQLQDDILAIRYDYDMRITAIVDNITALQTTERKFEADTDGSLNTLSHTLKDVRDSLSYQEYQINRLSNGTSNADVLDRLKETREEVKARLEREHGQVFSALQESQRNVSQRLEQNSLELAATKARVESSLTETVQYMQEVVGVASTNIRSIQRNVTLEIDAMTEHVQKIVHKLGEEVKEAEDTIHQEVLAVQENIEQYVAVTDKQFAAENDFVKYQLAGTFTLLGCLISLWHLTSHLRHYYKPDVQRRIMAVLWMVPIYSITSWLSLVWPSLETFLGAVRDCYEAYAVYTFIALLIAIIEDGRGLNGMINKLAERVVEERDAVAEYERLVAERAPTRSFFFFSTGGSGASGDASGAAGTGADVNPRLPPRPVEHIVPPCPCCYRIQRPTTVAAAWLYQCQLMAAQFVIMRPLLTIVPLLLKHAGVCDIGATPVYINGSINWYAPNLYVLFTANLSVGVAFYGLLSFYHGTEKDLEWCDPWPKFLCIKGVVFCTFWQSLTIQMLSAAGRVDEHSAAQVQNLLICIEMFIAAIAHFYIFPYEEWKDGYKREKEKGIMLKDTLALRDFVKDMSLMVTSWNTETEMEILNEEKAKLTSELYTLASMSHHDSGSKRNSSSRSGSHSLSASPTTRGAPPHLGDLERGISYQQSGINFAAFSFDSHAAGTAPGETERLLSVTGSGQDLPGISFASRGMKRSVSTDVGGDPRAAYGYGAMGSRSNSTALFARPGFDRSESLRMAILSKLQQLAPDGSPLPDYRTRSYEKLSGSREGVSSMAVDASDGAQDRDRSGATGGSDAAEMPVYDRPDGWQQFEEGDSEAGAAGAEMVAGKPRSFHRGHADSLTYSPDGSRQDLYYLRELERSASASANDLMGTRLLERSDGAGAEDLCVEGAVDVIEEGEDDEEENEEVSSIESDTAVVTPKRRLDYSTAEMTDPADPSHNGSAGSISVPGGTTAAFRDVHTPPLPDYSPLPEVGQGTWSKVKGAGQHEDDDSDQSMYAV